MLRTLVLIVSATASLAPAARPQDARFDFSGVDAFYGVAAKLATDAEPNEAEWSALLGTLGYRLAAVNLGPSIRADIDLALKPSRRAERDTILSGSGERRLVLHHLIEAWDRRQEMMRFRDSLAREDVIAKALTMAGTLLPPDATSRGAPPPVAVAIFRDDGYSVPGGIVIDLLALRYVRFELYLAHEFHHTFVDRLSPLPAGADTAYDANLRTTLHFLRSEGIADLIDKPYPFAPLNPGLQEYAARYNQEYARTPAVLRSFDSLLVRAGASRANMRSMGMELQMAFWSNGHPNGAYIAREIRETFGDDSIRASAANPARFLRVFAAAERARGRADPLSPTAWGVIRKLEARHWAGAPRHTAPGSDTANSGRFAIFKLQHHVGAETWSRTTRASGDSVDVDWDFTYIGSRVKLAESLVRGAGGRPVALHAHGSTSTLTDVDLDVDLTSSPARVTDRSRQRTAPVEPAAFPLHMYPPAAVEEALFVWWVARGRPASLPLAPTGRVRFERRGADTLAGGVVAERYSVDGVLWGRQSLWVDRGGRVIATVSGDAELDRFEEVREGFEVNLPVFVAGAVRDGLGDLARASRSAPPRRTGQYAIAGARVIDGTGAPPIEDAVILVRGGRIAAIGPRTRVHIPPGMPVEEARGRTVIPGLWDMHVHFEQVEWPMAQLAAGVTTARDVGNELELATGLRDAIAAGRVPGPRLLLAGLIDGAPDGLGAFVADTPDESRRIVQRYHDAGYQQVKIYGSLSPTLVPVVAEEAHRLGMTVTGHVPRGMNARQFVEAGGDMINHMGYVVALLQAAPPAGQPRPPLDLSTPAATELLAFFKTRGLVLDPTLARSEQNAHPKDSAFAVYEPGASHAPAPLIEALNASGSPSATARTRLASLERSSALIPALVHAGIPVVAGTDLVVPGHSIGRELELYVRAGLTPMEALQAATIVPARAMHLDAESGTLAQGKRADLVILDANPLDNISNVRRVWAVVAAGKMFRPAPLWRAAGFTP